MLIALHKPYDVLSQFTPEGPGQRTLAEFGLPKEVYPLGRLDRDSEGLLLLTNERALVDRLLNPRHGHPRTYEVLVERVVNDREVLAQLGVSKKPAVGGEIIVADGRFVLLGRDDDLFHLRWDGPGTVWELMERAGALPLRTSAS